MKFNEINKVFTNKVAEYIARGYVINSNSMAGSQGETAKIDLAKDDELIRIWINPEHSFGKWSDKNSWHGSAEVLRVSRWTKPAKESTWSTVWMSELDTIEETIYYKISRNGDWYVEDLQEALDAQNKNYNRYKGYSRVDREVTYNDDQTKEIAVKAIKRKLGYKRVNRDNVTVKKVYNYDVPGFKYVIACSTNTLVLAPRY